MAMSDERIEGRAELTAEEKAVGSEDPEDQAREILEDSDERLEEGTATASSPVEHRTSDETVEPLD
jgi:hypothetical protein